LCFVLRRFVALVALRFFAARRMTDILWPLFFLAIFSDSGCFSFPSKFSFTLRTDRSVCATWQLLGFGPGAEGAAEVYELAEVVRIVVGQHQRLAQNALALPVRNRRIQIGARIFD
jgi:hypothetical protein